MEIVNKVYIERLQPQDIPWVAGVAAVRMLVEELKIPEYVNADGISSLVNRGYEEGTIRVAKLNNEPIGVVGALATQNLFNPKLTTLTEVFFYVLPEHRKSRAGYLLFKEYNKMVDEIADDATFSILSGSAMGESLLLKTGYVKTEVAYRRKG
jgi:hypothetical protein